MKETNERKMSEGQEAPPVDPLQAAIVQAILVAGILAIHFGGVRLW